MKSTVKVSVIIPVYNVEKYIEECVRSVCNQTLRDIEIICVNDGTPDQSMKIVKALKKEDDRIVIVNKENGGLSSARNAGLQVAQGEYIHFLDSDDYLRQNALEELYKIAIENRLDNIYFDAESFFDSEEERKRNEYYLTYYVRNEKYDKLYSGKELFTIMMENNDFKPSACLQMPRRKILEKAEIKFYEGILHEDNLFTVQTLIVSNRVMHLDNPFYMRRVHDDSIMTRGKGVRNSLGYFIAELEIMKFIENRPITVEFTSALVKYVTSIQKIAIDVIKNLNADQIEEGLKNVPESIRFQYRIFIEQNAIIKKQSENQRQWAREREEIYRREIEQLRNSHSYKLGHLLMMGPGLIKRLIQRR